MHLIKPRKRNKVIRNTVVTSIVAASLIFSIVLLNLNKNITAQKNDIQDKLAQTYWDQGITAAEQNDFLKSLLYTSEAMQTLNDDPNRKELILSTANDIPLLALQNVFTTKNNITEAHISGDGKLILTLSDDAWLQVWDAMNDSISATPLYKLANVSHAAFSKDCKKILVIENGQLNTIVITGFQKRMVSNHLNINAASFCADNSTIIGKTEYDSLYKWQPENNSYTQTLIGVDDGFFGNPGTTKYVEISEDVNSDHEKIIIFYKDPTAVIFNRKTARQFKYPANIGPIQKAAFIGNSDSLLLSTAKGIAIFDANTTNQLSAFFKTDQNAVSFLSPDNYHVLVLNDKGIISIYNTAGKYLGLGNNLNNPKQFSFEEDYKRSIFSGNEFEFSNNGKSIITFNGNTVLLYHLLPEPIIPQPKELSGNTKYNLASKKSLINPDSNVLRIWDLNGVQTAFKPLHINAAYNQIKQDLIGEGSSNDFSYVQRQGTPYIYYENHRQKKYILDFEMDSIISLQDSADYRADAVSTDGNQLTYSLKNGSGYIRKAPDWKAVQLFDSTKKIATIFSINHGKNIILTTEDSCVQLWNNNIPIKGKPIINLPKANLKQVAENGKWFIAEQKKIATIYILNEKGDISHSIATPETGFDFDEAGEGSGWSVSPDGEWIYSETTTSDGIFNGSMYNTSTGKIWQLNLSAEIANSTPSPINFFSSDSKYFTVLPRNWSEHITSNPTISLKIYSLQNLNSKDSVLPQYGKTVKLNTNSPNIEFCKYNTNVIFINTGTGFFFLDIRKGKKIIEYNFGLGDSFISGDGEKIYTHDTLGNLLVYSADLDMPAALYKKQAMVLSGSQLNLSTGEIENLPPLQWQQLKKEYMAEAAEHYHHCNYLNFNIWANIYPELAAKLKP